MAQETYQNRDGSSLTRWLEQFGEDSTRCTGILNALWLRGTPGRQSEMFGDEAKFMVHYFIPGTETGAQWRIF